MLRAPARGARNTAIAAQLGITERTVRPTSAASTRGRASPPARRPSRWRSSASSSRLRPVQAAMFDNRLAGRLSGAAALIERAGVREGMPVLDAGCGPGRLTIPLARRVGAAGQVVAPDIQQGRLARVAANAARDRLTNIRPVRGGLEAMPRRWSHSSGRSTGPSC